MEKLAQTKGIDIKENELRLLPPTKAVRRYSIAELEKMALEAESETARLLDELPKYDVSSNGKESEKKE